MGKLIKEQKVNDEKSLYQIMLDFGFSMNTEVDEDITKGLRSLLFKKTFEKLSKYSDQVSERRNDRDRIMFWKIVMSDANVRSNGDVIYRLKNYFDPYNGSSENPEAILTELRSRGLLKVCKVESSQLEQPEQHF